MKNRILLISLVVLLVLSGGVAGCGGDVVPEITEYNLTISSTGGGSVTSPGEGTFTYDEGTVINLVAEPDDGYRFENWTGDVSSIADVNAATTIITTDNDYSITANFAYGPAIPLKNPGSFIQMTITDVDSLDPAQGALGVQLECLRFIADDLAGKVPFIQTVFSPLAQAKNLVGRECLPVHLRCYPDAVHAGLEVIAETAIRFIEAAYKTGIDGLFYAVQHAQYGVLSREEYAAFGRSYDLRILEAAQELWLNVLHLHGTAIMFDRLADYPVQVINWHDRETKPTLVEAQQRVGGAVCGGLQRWQVVVQGVPGRVREQAADAIAQTEGKRFILGTGCVTPIVAPAANIRAARESVEECG